MTQTTAAAIPVETRDWLLSLVERGAEFESLLHEGGTLRYAPSPTDDYLDLSVAADGTDEWYVDVRFSIYNRRAVSSSRRSLGLARDSYSRQDAELVLVGALVDAGLYVPEVPLPDVRTHPVFAALSPEAREVIARSAAL